MLLSASGAGEPAYPSQIHWIHGAKRGDSGFAEPNITVRDTVVYDNLFLVYHYANNMFSNKCLEI